MNAEISKLHRQIASLKKRLRNAQQKAEPKKVKNFTLATPKGDVALRDLFGRKRDLIVVHNMGRSCPYCTLWADGYNGLVEHIESRAAFVVVSPDAPKAQQKFAKSRGWKFKMASDKTGAFTKAMGYLKSKSGWWPAVSAFHLQDDGTIVRTGTAVFGPGDDFCALWPMFDLLKGGAGRWSPKYRY
jgi:predicted dithiol-disulfide oxidoreductase (DUF899 family)